MNRPLPLREPALLRLAQSIEELNPCLARALCRSGLEALGDTPERADWSARLREWLEEGDDGVDGTVGAAN